MPPGCRRWPSPFLAVQQSHRRGPSTSPRCGGLLPAPPGASLRLPAPPGASRRLPGPPRASRGLPKPPEAPRLANGTRGTLVGAVNGPGGIGSMPEALVVEVAEYTGPAFYPEEPKWVSILPIAAFKDGTRLTRAQVPVVVGFALTVNKA